jgi:endoglucanase
MLSNGLRWLTVEGRHIVEGASRSEPSAQGFLQAAGLCESEIAHIVDEWGANIIRIPFNQDWVLHGRRSLSAEAYLDAIDQVILWASRAGAYTLLDLQWLDADVACGSNPDGSCNRVPPLPTRDSLVTWSVLARRYRDEPAVLFDLFNEPHDPIADDPIVLTGIDEDGTAFPVTGRRVTMAAWQPWARHLVRAVRCEHPRALIFVSGVRWAYDLRGMPLTIANGSTETFANLVYSTHVYPWSGTPAGTRRLATSQPPHAGVSWREAFGELSRRSPVFIAEWGGGTEDVGCGERLVRYARRLGIGWTAWSWSDRPRLVADAQRQWYEPTDFGRLVLRSLTGSLTPPPPRRNPGTGYRLSTS